MKNKELSYKAVFYSGIALIILVICMALTSCTSTKKQISGPYRYHNYDGSFQYQPHQTHQAQN